MNLLLFNLKLDENDTVLGFTSDWVREFAKHVDELFVITMSTGEYNLPPNVKVFSIGWEKGYSKVRLVYNFYTHLFKILKNHRIDGCFSHMQPIFTSLAGPLLRSRRIKIVTWYAHPQVTPILKVSHFFSNHTVASVYNAYPYKKNKLFVIGQAIDTNKFIPNGQYKKSLNRILYTGRISPVKNILTLIQAAAILKKKNIPTPEVLIIGDAIQEQGKKYLEKLNLLIKELDLEDMVKILPGVKRSELISIYQKATLFVNLTAVGFGDKVAWEAMSCGVPTLVANTDFKETVGKYEKELIFACEDPVALAEKLVSLLSKTDEALHEMGIYLRQQVIQFHSLQNLPFKVLNLLK